MARTGGLAFGLSATAAVLDISDIIQFFDLDKLSSILQLKVNLEIFNGFFNFLLKCFNGTITSVSNLIYILSAGMLSFVFVLYSEDLLFLVLLLFIL